MKARVDGIEVEGTPEEIAAFVAARKPAPVMPAPPDMARAHEAERRLAELLSRVPNVNITPLARHCPGPRRYC